MERGQGVYVGWQERLEASADWDATALRLMTLGASGFEWVALLGRGRLRWGTANGRGDAASGTVRFWTGSGHHRPARAAQRLDSRVVRQPQAAPAHAGDRPLAPGG